MNIEKIKDFYDKLKANLFIFWKDRMFFLENDRLQYYDANGNINEVSEITFDIFNLDDISNLEKEELLSFLKSLFYYNNVVNFNGFLYFWPNKAGIIYEDPIVKMKKKSMPEITVDDLQFLTLKEFEEIIKKTEAIHEFEIYKPDWIFGSLLQDKDFFKKMKIKQQQLNKKKLSNKDSKNEKFIYIEIDEEVLSSEIYEKIEEQVANVLVKNKINSVIENGITGNIINTKSRKINKQVEN